MATHPTWVRKIFIALGIAGILVSLLMLSLQLWVQPVVDQTVRLGLSQLHDQGYDIDYQKLKFQPFRKVIVLEDVSVTIDTTQHRQKKFFAGELKRLAIKLDKYPYWETDRFLSIRQISLQQPTVWLYPSDSSTKPAQLPEATNYYSLIQPFLDSLLIANIQIKDGIVKRINHDAQYSDTLEIAGINLDLEDLFIDSLQASHNQGRPSVASLVISADSLRRLSNDSLYTFSVARVNINVLDSTVRLRDVRVQPNFSKNEWRKHLDDRKDRMQSHVAAVQITGVSPSRWIDSRQLISERISIDSATLEIYKDKRLRRASGGIRPLLPALLQSVPFQFRVDTITLSDSRIVYEEQNTESEHAGSISFDRFYASLYRTSNIADPESVFEANIQANLMNSGRLQLSVTAPLNRTDEYHKVTGELDQMPLDKMNSFLEPVAFASVQTGTLNKLSFDMDVTNQSAEGEVYCIYNDLKISLLNPDDPDKPEIRELLGTWLANWFVVKTDNPTRNQSLRVGSIYFERDTSRSMFSYWCHSLLSGLKESIGLSKPGETTAMAPPPTEEKKERPGLFKRLFKKK